MYLHRIVLLSLLLITVNQAYGQVSAADQIYQNLKQIEDSGVFPIPTPSQLVTVGSFNAATGQFSGLKTRVEHMPAGDRRVTPGAATTTDPARYVGNYRVVITRVSGSPSSINSYPSVSIDAVRVNLKFNIVNSAASEITVTVNGESTQFPAGTHEVIVDAGDGTEARWTLASSTNSYSDTVEFRRMPIVGGGAFTVPAFPVTLLYEPPTDREGKNSASYSSSHQLCTENQWAFTNISTTPVSVEPVVVPYIGRSDLQAISSGAVTALTVASTIYPSLAGTIGPVKQAFQNLVGFMDQAFGTSRAAATVAESGERGGRFVFCKELQGKLDTAPNNGGPGKGDIYTYLRNARFAWIAANGPVRLVYLGAEGTVTTTTSAILAALESDDPSDLSALGLTEETALALLDLNPYVSTATPNLSLPRYYWVDQLTMGCGGGQGFSNGFSLGDETLQETHQTTNRVYTETQNAEPGFLSFLGLGVTESVNYSLELRQWNYSSESTSGSRHAAVNLYCSAVESDPYVLDVYLDVVFNTYAITELTNTKAGPWIKGVAYGNDGKALAREKIVLESGGQRHRTFTDKNGQFQIYARNLKPGRAVIHSAVSRLNFGFNRNRLPATIELRPVGTKIKYRELKKHVPHELPTPTVPAMPVKPIHN